MGETDHCRSRLMKYCRGQGVDLGCGNVRIKPDAIGIDLHNPNADMKADARVLKEFPDGHFDYIYSSHLLEELQNTEATLKEWLRILKPDGYLVLYQADEELYYPLGHPNCNKAHKHHFSWKTLWAVLEKMGGVKLVHHGRHPELDEWSFELVVKKTDKEIKETSHNQGISLLIPTLNRPKSVETFSKSVDGVTKNPDNVEIVFGVHEEDLASIEKIAELNSALKIEVRPEIIKRWEDNKPHLSYLWNQLFEKATYPIVGYFGDDVLFKTPGWDEEIRKEFDADRSVMVLCNDVHVQRGKQATLFFTHRTIHERIGYYLNMGFRRWYADTMLGNIYRTAGKQHYREDIITEHLHPDKFPDRIDDTYKRMEVFKEEDRRLWVSKAITEEGQRCIKIVSSGAKWVISFSLWGSDPKYLNGALENMRLQKIHYPGWTCRFYVDETVPKETVSELASLGAEIVHEEISDGYKGLFWRFKPAFDPDVQKFLVRDCDSRLNAREASAIREWDKSGKSFHTMRDHKGHDIRLLGAMWGAKKGFLAEFKALFDEFMKGIDGMAEIKRERFFYTDQRFLNDKIWPLVKDKAMIHDDSDRFHEKAKQFKVKLPDGQFVGQQWGADNKPLAVPL